MLVDHDLKGADLPARTLCLTYDDGPGPGTRELGRFLHDQGIRAAFFVIGSVAASQGELLRQLADWGHIIGNHTWTHPGLVNLERAGGDVVEELARTDAAIRPYVSGPVYFRPPYGSWREKTRPDGPEDAPTSIVAQRLRASGRFEDYIGPIKWDIVGEDWKCWEQGLDVVECTRRHLQAVERVGKGIVLLHDSSEQGDLRCRNCTMQMTRELIPALMRAGYCFVGLDEVPQVIAAQAAPALPSLDERIVFRMRSDPEPGNRLAFQ